MSGGLPRVPALYWFTILVLFASRISNAQNLPDSAAVSRLVKDLGDPQPRIREAAIDHLSAMGGPAVPQLVRALQDTSALAATSAAIVVGRLGVKAAAAAPQLQRLLRARGYLIRYEAAAALGHLGAAAAPAIPDLIALLNTDDRGLCYSAELALGNLGQRSLAAVPRLTALLKDDQGLTVGGAAFALGRIGTGAAIAKPSLFAILESSEESSRREAAQALGQIAGFSPEEWERLGKGLTDPSRGVRIDVLEAVGKQGRTAAVVSTRIGAVLSDPDYFVRSAAATTLQQLGPAAQGALPTILTALRDTSRADLLESLLAAVDSMGPRAAAAIPLLAQLLDDPSVHDAARHALLRMGPRANEVIIARLRTKKFDSRFAASLEEMGIKTLPQLLRAIRSGDPNVRLGAVLALAAEDPLTDSAKAAILNAADDSAQVVREAARFGVTRIGAGLIGQLHSSLHAKPYRVRVVSAEGLGDLGSAAKDALPELRMLLADPSMAVRGAAGYAIASIVGPSRDLIPPLLEALHAERDSTRHGAAVSLKRIAVDLQDHENTDALQQLRAVRDSLAENDDPSVREQTQEVRRAIDALTNLFWRGLRDNAIAWSRAHLRLVIGFIVVIALLLIWTVIYVAHPLTLWRINEWLQPLSDVTLPEWAGGARIPLRYLVLVGFFHYRDRVLDAWVRQNYPRVWGAFQRRVTVQERQVFVPLPVSVDATTVASPVPATFQPLFSADRTTVLIIGEGGAGKTTLACQFARWSASDLAKDRLMRHRSLPILIEFQLEGRSGEPLHDLLRTIRGQLTAAAGRVRPVSEGFMRALLARRRLLVVLDHWSEMDDYTRSALHPDDPTFPLATLVVTSRTEESLRGTPHHTLRPLRIDGSRLSSFMEAYLTQRGVRALFDDAEYFEHCRRLSDMVGERDATVLLAKLYAEQMIAAKQGQRSPRLPTNVPELILSYLNDINRLSLSSGIDDRLLHRAAKMVAWECLRRHYRPMTAGRERVRDELKNIVTDTDAVLSHLEERLRVIQTVGAAKNELRFTLDPIAEYLAAMRLTELLGNSETAWQTQLAEMDQAEGAPTSIRGFLLALRDCCQSSSDLQLPGWLGDELARRSGLDPTAIKSARLRQRIRRLTAGLYLPDLEDRVASATLLASIGLEAIEAGPELEALLPEAEPAFGEAIRMAIHAIRGYAPPSAK
jgi:HEAT repeat protein